MAIIAYARVSKDEQNADLQLDDLKAHGYDKLYSEKVSGAKKDGVADTFGVYPPDYWTYIHWGVKSV